jgi:hypothetical protein
MAFRFILILLRIFFEFVDVFVLYLHEFHAGVHSDMMPTATAASGILSELPKADVLFFTRISYLFNRQ